jgi:hypothetical protein
MILCGSIKNTFVDKNWLLFHNCQQKDCLKYAFLRSLHEVIIIISAVIARLTVLVGHLELQPQEC